MNENEARELLKPFCASEPGCYALDEVGCRDGWLFGTSGHVAVRLPVPGVPDTPDLAPPINSLPWSSKVVGPWPAMESAGEPSLGTEECDCLTPCDACTGTGGTPCSQCGQTVECKKCGGREIVAMSGCATCKGTGKIAVTCRFTRVGKKKIDEKYWRLIAALPGVQLAKSEKGASDPIAFAFDGGGQGLVMPVTS